MTDQRSTATAVGTGSGLLVVAALGLLAWRTVRSGLDNLLGSLPTAAHTPLTRALAMSLGVLVVGLAACAAGAAWLRWRATSRTLASRVLYVVLPADDLDPSEDAVLRAAGQLSRVRRAVLGWLDTRATAVRLRLDSGPDGRMVYRIQVARRARSVVRSAITSMGNVELRDETPATEEGAA
jgi:hypothetical protein